jgi:hypothetical protein
MRLCESPRARGGQWICMDLASPPLAASHLGNITRCYLSRRGGLFRKPLSSAGARLPKPQIASVLATPPPITATVGPYDQALQDVISQLPPVAGQEAWADCIRDGATFIATWGETAFGHGWAASDIFGAPQLNGDAFCAGIAWRLKGRRVQSLAADFARIGANGALFCRQTGRELFHPDAVGYTQ